MNVRMLGFAALATLGLGLTSCDGNKPYRESIEQNKKIIRDTKIPYDDFIKMEKRIDSVAISTPFWSRNYSRERALGWQNEVNKIVHAKDSAASAKRVKAAIDSTRIAVIDSMNKTIKYAGKIK